jgi:hypothetical protein
MREIRPTSRKVAFRAGRGSERIVRSDVVIFPGA